jgi:hypothetical protein
MKSIEWNTICQSYQFVDTDTKEVILLGTDDFNHATEIVDQEYGGTSTIDDIVADAHRDGRQPMVIRKSNTSEFGVWSLMLSNGKLALFTDVLCTAQDYIETVNTAEQADDVANEYFTSFSLQH